MHQPPPFYYPPPCKLKKVVHLYKFVYVKKIQKKIIGLGLKAFLVYSLSDIYTKDTAIQKSVWDTRI